MSKHLRTGSSPFIMKPFSVVHYRAQCAHFASFVYSSPSITCREIACSPPPSAVGRPCHVLTRPDRSFVAHGRASRAGAMSRPCYPSLSASRRFRLGATRWWERLEESSETESGDEGKAKLNIIIPSRSGMAPTHRAYTDGPGPLTREGLAEAVRGELLLAPLTRGGMRSTFIEEE
jgi:hypothetical protein